MIDLFVVDVQTELGSKRLKPGPKASNYKGIPLHELPMSESLQSEQPNGCDGITTTALVQPPELTIRLMTIDDLAETIEWAAKEGWNPGNADAGPFLKADEQSFFMGFLGEERVCSISAVRYGEALGFIGLYICVPGYRRRGFGLAMFNRAMEHLRNHVIGLDAVPQQVANYTKRGFVPAHYQLHFEGAPCFSDEDIQHLDGLVAEGLSDRLMPSLLEFDRKHFPGPRESFLRAWVRNQGHVVKVVVRNETILGYGVVRPCHRDAKVGPLFATSSEVAWILWKSLASALPPQTNLCVDIPAPNVSAVELVQRLGLTKKFDLVRMYKGSPPQLPLESIFAISTLELG